jgi:hypothetical protein
MRTETIFCLSVSYEAKTNLMNFLTWLTDINNLFNWFLDLILILK